MQTAGHPEQRGVRRLLGRDADLSVCFGGAEGHQADPGNRPRCRCNGNYRVFRALFYSMAPDPGFLGREGVPRKAKQGPARAAPDCLLMIC